jgi:serine/threonine protein kinase
LEPSRRLGRYLVHERIGRGGMGEVWLASAEGPHGFRKKVVLKIVRPDLAERRDLVDMLIREAAIAAKLNHPNLVQVFDLDEVDGTYFFAMEHVLGATLAEVMRAAQVRGVALEPWFVLAVVAACCDGLHYAHELADEHGRALGLVHRDISLGNIMVGATGNVTILDFGIAVASAAGLETESGMLKGKFQYMPPESVRGEPIDRRCDVYGLGAVMYVTLTGRVPYPDLADYALLRTIAARPPTAISAVRADLPGSVARLVEAAMAHDRRDRFPDAAALGAAARDLLRERGAPSNEDVARYVAHLCAPDDPDAVDVSIDAPAERHEISIDVDDLVDQLLLEAHSDDLAIPEARPDDSPSARTTPVTARATEPPPTREGTPATRLSATALLHGPPAPARIPASLDPDRGDVFTGTTRPRAPHETEGNSIFDGWTRTVRRADTEDPAEPPRWPWSR